MQLYADAVSSGKENECVEKKILKSQLIGKRKSDKIKVDKTPEPTSKKIVLKQSVLAVKSHPQAAPAPVYQLDPVLIAKWQKSGAAKFCQKVQRYLRSSHGNSKFPTVLRDSEQNAVNIIGSAIVDATEEENTEKQVKIILGRYLIFCASNHKRSSTEFCYANIVNISPGWAHHLRGVWHYLPE